MNKSPMPKLPSLPKARTLSYCECGCKGLTGNRFVPGHDAKLAGAVKRVRIGVFDPEHATDPMAQLDAALTYLTVSQVEATARAMGLDWDEEAYLARVEVAEAQTKTA